MIYMFALALLLIQIYLYLARSFLVQKKTFKKILFICTILLIVIWTAHQGIGIFLLFNVWILIAVFPLSYCLYIASLWIVGTKFRFENLFPLKCFSFRGELKTLFTKESIGNVYSSTYEELLYRWFFQNALYELTQNSFISVAITIIVFWAIHIRKRIAIVQLIDIFVFSFVITLWFAYTKNPIYCIIIHILRNQLVICQRYVEYQKDRYKKNKYLILIRERNIKENES